MKIHTSLIIVIAAVCYLIPGVQIAATFNPERLRLIDSNGSSLIVRGNAPLNRRGKFDPALVMDAIQEYLTPEKDLRRYKIVVLSLVSPDHSDERAVLEEQIQFWDCGFAQCRQENNNDEDSSIPLGELVHRPIVGSWVAPPPLGNIPLHAHINKAVWNFWRPDDGAWDLVEEIQTIFMNANKKDDSSIHDGVVIYFHCMRGMDRTGLVAGSYMTRYLNATEEQVRRLNYDVARRKLNWPARNALKWIGWKGRQQQ